MAAECSVLVHGAWQIDQFQPDTVGYAESLMSACGVVDIENLQAGTRGTNGAIC